MHSNKPYGLVVMLFLLCTFSIPTTSLNSELDGDKYEGDILLSKTQRVWLTTGTTSFRNVLLSPDYRWPNGIVYYRISSQFSANDDRLIYQAMAKISERSCVRFIVAAPFSTRHVNIVRTSNGCFSYVGYQRRIQPLNLANGCMNSGIIQHELLHALGFYHQQSDPNRDLYVEIQYQNIEDGRAHNFNKYPTNILGDFGIGYDYGSVMHYGAYFFSKNGKPTIVVRQANAKIGQRNGLSDVDFQKLNRMYNC